MGNAKIVNRNCYRVSIVGSVALKHVLPDPLKGQYTFTSLSFENKRPYFMAPASFSMQN